MDHRSSTDSSLHKYQQASWLQPWFHFVAREAEIATMHSRGRNVPPKVTTKPNQGLGDTGAKQFFKPNPSNCPPYPTPPHPTPPHPSNRPRSHLPASSPTASSPHSALRARPSATPPEPSSASEAGGPWVEVHRFNRKPRPFLLEHPVFF